MRLTTLQGCLTDYKEYLYYRDNYKSSIVIRLKSSVLRLLSIKLKMLKKSFMELMIQLKLPVKLALFMEVLYQYTH